MTVETVFRRTPVLTGKPTHYCPGCNHGTIHRLVAEVIEELGVRERTVAVAPVGCAVLAYDYIDVDMTEAPHGRAPAVATGLKRALPDRVVFTYQGDGDLAAIGTAEIVHAAARGENITVVFVNNTNYGMTGGQMAPTTLPGQKTKTSPAGRIAAQHGHPLRVTEMLAAIDGVTFAQRTAVFNPRRIREARAAILKAFRNQIEGKGFSFVEVLSSCPTNWGMTPPDANRWVEETMAAYYPLGVFKDAGRKTEGGAP
jgi:2-oxoglutarate ferredoxin oxidoreductase subunit beta